MTKGYVYILKNVSMPGLLKIGKTTRSVQQRANELWQTGVPTPFEIVLEQPSPDCDQLEYLMHKTFAEFRVTANREFFRVCEDKAACQLWDSQRAQIDMLVDDYCPDHKIVENDYVLDIDHLTNLAVALNDYEPSIANAMNLITPEEIAPALARWNAMWRTSFKEPGLDDG